MTISPSTIGLVAAPSANTSGSIAAPGRSVEIVGVAQTIKYQPHREPMDFVYLPLAQHPVARMVLMLRSSGDPLQLVQPVKDAVRSIDPNLPMLQTRSYEDYYLAEAIRAPQIAIDLVGSMGLVGLLLAIAGLYGLVAYNVSRRTHEIGIRMALGAAGSDVLRMVMGKGIVLVALGTALGLVMGFGLERLMNSMLFDSGGVDVVATDGGADIAFGDDVGGVRTRATSFADRAHEASEIRVRRWVTVAGIGMRGRHFQEKIDAEKTEDRIRRPSGQQGRQLSNRAHRFKQRGSGPIDDPDSHSDGQAPDGPTRPTRNANGAPRNTMIAAIRGNANFFCHCTDKPRGIKARLAQALRYNRRVASNSSGRTAAPRAENSSAVLSTRRATMTLNGA